ncbi:DUF7344 domain-containing protein [Halobacterium yunchengense]|uniref:DUF7344 domain-containing protein n=1 Tax=Halobacterium yunchengense TaxID=3108497 RepID=UPI00300B7A64
MGVNPDDLLAVLSNRDCRVVLRELDDGPRTVDELGAALAAADDVRSERDGVTAAHHVVVPKLRRVGLVDVDASGVSAAIDAGRADASRTPASKHTRHA